MSSDSDEKLKKEKLARLMVKTICICKGIRLARFLPHLDKCTTVEDVNRLVGSGSGDCQGMRCGPRIQVLLDHGLEGLDTCGPAEDEYD